MTLYLFAFFSGIVTIFAPCIWPLLPIILSAGATGGSKRPFGIVLGIAASFLFATLFLTLLLGVVPLPPEFFRVFGVAIIIALGVTLLVPALNKKLEGVTSRLASFAPAVKMSGTGFWSGLITGAALGLVWSPCAGPILATVATVAATQGVSIKIFLIALLFVAGMALPLFFIALLGQKVFRGLRLANKYTQRVRQLFGLLVILIGIMIYTGFDKTIQSHFMAVCGSAASWFTSFERNPVLEQDLRELRVPAINE